MSDVIGRPVCQHCEPVVTVDGEPWRMYDIEYWFEGKNWPVTIYARSWAEAEARAEALQHAKVTGEIHAVIRVDETTAPFVRPLMDFWCWLHNKFSPPTS